MKSLQALRMSESGRIKFKFCVCSTLLCRMRVSIFRLSYLNSEVIQNMAWEAIEERNIKIIWAKWWQLAQGEIEENKWWMPFHLAKPLPNEHTRWWLFSSRKLSFMNDTLKNMSKFLKTTMSRAPSVYISMCVYLLLYILNKAPSQVSQLSLTWIYHSPRSYMRASIQLLTHCGVRLQSLAMRDGALYYCHTLCTGTGIAD